MDGRRTVDEILSTVSDGARNVSARLLSALAANGAIDVSGRPIGRFLHAATKKGVHDGGGLESDDVLRLATDGNYRIYADAAQIALDDAVPERLRTFHSLTRARRSRRDYAGKPITSEEFASLLHTACGITGTMPWEGRELKLRAYPSSGALYAVEIYPVALNVEGLEPGVYHYRAGGNVLDVVGLELSRDRFISAMLPVERQMVAGAAAMICLAGRFKRHERKYGQGGYRMMVAEAGHISQNLVLAAVALGMSARPFGGVFDGLLNEHLGLDEDEEQFLLSVLVGHAGSDNAETSRGTS
jgi:SagB-type dehydrogenase family enzyme